MRISQWKQKILSGGCDGELSMLYGEAQPARMRYASLLDTFGERFGDKDAVLVSAPGRTELAGNHTDHQCGRVLCAAIHEDILAAAARRSDNRVRIVSEGFDDIELSLADTAPRSEERGTSAALVRGIAAQLRARGVPMGGLDAAITSSVPVGGGFSSSAALEVLLSRVFGNLYYVNLPLNELAQIGQRAEREYFGKPCGLMDQTASAWGGITEIDFFDPLSPAVTPLSFDFRSHGYVLAAVSTGSSHADLTEDYAAIPREMGEAAAFYGQSVLRYVNQEQRKTAIPENSRISSRARARSEHFFDENDRVPRMALALCRGDMVDYCREMNASGRSSRYRLQNVIPPTHPEQTDMALALDRSEALLAGNGAWRIHGGGFAGSIQCLIPADLWPDFRTAMDGYYGPGACRELSVRPVGVYSLSDM